MSHREGGVGVNGVGGRGVELKKMSKNITADTLENLCQIFHLILFVHICIDIYICHHLLCVLHVNRVLISFILFIYLFILPIFINSI